MSEQRICRVNTPTVASQIIDGEVVMIHFETGCYYSTDKIGAEIVSLINEKVAVDSIVAQLSGRCEAEPSQVETAVLAFLGELKEEQLIVDDPTATATASPNSSASPKKYSFEPPILQKYTDLEDLLLLDPIHDTDEAGWPTTKVDP